MPTRYGVSPWVAGFPSSRRPALPRARGELTASVVVIGAGLTGCATALSLALAGIRPVLLEAGRIGQHTGRTAGMLSTEPGPTFRDVQSMHGLRAARMVFEGWRRSALDAAAQIRRMGIRCGLEPCDGLVVAGTDRDRSLRRDFDARDAAGLDAAWLGERQARESTRLNMPAAMRVRGGFTLDPYRACVGLLAAAIKRGAVCFEASPAQKVTATARGVEISVPGGVVRASSVIVATGTATPEFKPLRRHFRQRERYLALTEPVPATIRRELFPSGVSVHVADTPRRDLRWAADHRLLVSGGDQDETPPKRRSAVLLQRTGQLMYETLTLFPAISGLKPEYGWDASYGDTADGLMYIGPHRNYPHHLFALGGDGGSVTGAFVAARILTRAVQGAPHRGDEVFGWTR